MSNVLPIKTVTKNILEGIKKAEKDYREWSGDDWLWRAPEYLLWNGMSPIMLPICSSL